MKLQSTHWYKQTLVNSGAIKNFVKSVKYLEFLANVYFNVPQCYYRLVRLRQNYVISLLCAV